MIISAELNRGELANNVLGNNSTSAIMESLLWSGKSITKAKIKYGVAYLRIWLVPEDGKKYAPTICWEVRGAIEFENEQTLYESEKILSDDYYRAMKEAIDSIIEKFVEEISGATTSWTMFESELKRQSKKRKWYKFWRW